MTQTGETSDHEAIRRLIGRQFESLSWNARRAPEWAAFSADFLPGALLFPAARPVRPVTVPEFVERMKRAASSTMPVIEETLLGVEISLYGNVAVALAVCGQHEGNGPPARAVEALLLVREGGAWRIAAQGWDTEREDVPIPPALLG
jgi:hypothetical protein